MSQDVHPFSNWVPQFPLVPSNCIAMLEHQNDADWPDIDHAV